MALSAKDASGTSVTLEGVPSSTDAVYHAAKYGVAAVTSATDVVQISGSASKTVRILKARVSAVPGIGTAASQEVRMTRQSTAGSGGTRNTLVVNTDWALHDSSDSAATAVLKTFTATAATAGTLAGIIKAESLYFSAATVAPGAVEFNALSGGDKPIELHGTSEYFCIGFNGVTPGNTFNWELIWSESDL